MSDLSAAQVMTAIEDGQAEHWRLEGSEGERSEGSCILSSFGYHGIELVKLPEADAWSEYDVAIDQDGVLWRWDEPILPSEARALAGALLAAAQAAEAGQ